jgi:hypothetical protein
MAKGIHDLGNGLGFIYVTDTAGSRIYESVPNSKSGARKIKGLASAVSATSVNKRGVGSITASAITGSGSITAITVDGVNQISASISYTISTTVAQLHSLIESAINGYTPGSSPNMGASFVGSKVNLLAPIELGSDLNGYAISVSSTGNATFTTVDIAGGTDNLEAYDDNFGFRFYLDADYGLSDVTGSGSAVWGDKSNAEEITDYVIPRSLNSAITTIDSNISSGAVTFNRKSSQSFITVANQGFATTDDLDYIGIDGFSDGDLVTLKSKFNTVGVYTNVTETGNIRKAVDAPDIKLGNDTPNAAVFAVTLQLNNGFWYEVNRAESLSIGDLVDIDITTVPPIAGDSLVYNAGTGKFEPDTVGGGGGGSINSLSDVDTSTVPPTALDVLQWDGTNWVPAAAGGGGGGANLSVTGNTTSQLVIASDSGTDATLTSATTTLAGLMSGGDKTKLDFITVTGAADLDAIPVDVADLVTLSGVAANSTTLGTFTGTVISDNQTIKAAIQALETHLQSGISIFDLTNVSGTVAVADLLVWDGTDFATKSKSEAGLAQITTPLADRFIPRVTAGGDGYELTESLIYSGASTIGLFGATTTTYSVGMLAADRSIGIERQTTLSTAGGVLSIYAGGSTLAGTNLNGGNLNLYSGISTGTGTSQFNVYTCAAGSSGTTSVTPTLKLNINGAGTIEFTTSTANTKSRIGANLDTMCGVVQQNGLYLTTPDGSYEYPISMSVGTDYKAYFGGGNNGFMFVKNPQSDSHPLVAMGTSVTNISAGCEGSYNYRYQFQRAWNNGGNSTSMYVGTTGTNSISANVGLLELVNTVTNVNGSNYGLQISVTGSSTGTNQNVAISTTNGKVVFNGTKGDYDVSFGATADRTFGVTRELVAAVGRKLSIYGGSACAGNSNLAGGNVEIITGVSTGTGSADIVFKTTTAGASGTSDNNPTTKMTIKGSGVINFSSLPTSASGLSAGDLWNNSGIVTIV